MPKWSNRISDTFLQKHYLPLLVPICSISSTTLHPPPLSPQNIDLDTERGMDNSVMWPEFPIHLQYKSILLEGCELHNGIQSVHSMVRSPVERGVVSTRSQGLVAHLRYLSHSKDPSQKGYGRHPPPCPLFG